MKLKVYRAHGLPGREVTLFWRNWSLTLLFSFALLLEREEGGNIVWTNFKRNDV